MDQLGSISVSQNTDPYLTSLKFNKTVTIEDYSKSVLQIITELQISGETEHATRITESLAGRLIPEQFNVEFYINDTLVYSDIKNTITKDDAQFLIAQRRIIFGESGGEKLGPLLGVVYIW